MVLLIHDKNSRIPHRELRKAGKNLTYTKNSALQRWCTQGGAKKSVCSLLPRTYTLEPICVIKEKT